MNHNGDIELARHLIDAAVEAGADAVKFQTFKAGRVADPMAPKAEYQLRATNPAESQLDMLRRLELAPGAVRELQRHCRQRGIFFMSTPFDEESVDLLEELNVPAYKIGSGEITNLPLLEYIARKGRPVILSTGMSYLNEVDRAVRAIRDTGNNQLVLLHCVSNYPADPADANLLAMQSLAVAFQLPVGYSDHTPGVESALAAVALGACILEKHFTLDKGLPGPDQQASLEPPEFKQMIRSVRQVEQALGDGVKRPRTSEMSMRDVARRSIAAAADIKPGETIRREMLTARRPATGIEPTLIDLLVGRKSAVLIPAGRIISFDMLQ